MTKTNENVPTVLKHTPLQLLSQQFFDLGLRHSSSLLSLPLPLLSLPPQHLPLCWQQLRNYSGEPVGGGQADRHFSCS